MVVGPEPRLDGLVSVSHPRPPVVELLLMTRPPAKELAVEARVSSSGPLTLRPPGPINTNDPNQVLGYPLVAKGTVFDNFLVGLIDLSREYNYELQNLREILYRRRVLMQIDDAKAVSFKVTTIDDHTPDGLQQVQITASAAGLDSGFATLGITDVNLPDLVVSSVTAPTSGYDRAPLAISWTVTNSGQYPASGSWIDQVYLDPVGGR